MADEHNIILTPVLKTDEVIKSANDLRNALKNACSVNTKDLDNLDMRLDALQRRMREVTNAASWMTKALKDLKDQGAPSGEIEKLTDQLAKMNDQMKIYLTSWKDITEMNIGISTSSIDTGQKEELSEIAMIIRELSDDVGGLVDLFVSGQSADFGKMNENFISINEKMDDTLTNYYLMITKQKELNDEMEKFVTYWYQTVELMKMSKKASKGLGSNLESPIDVTATPLDDTGAAKLPEALSATELEAKEVSVAIKELGRLLKTTFGQAFGVRQISTISSSIKSLSVLLKNGLVKAVGYVKIAFQKLFAAIMAHPIIAVITAIIAALILLWKKLKKVIAETKEQVEAFFNAFSKFAKKAIKDFGKLTLSVGKSFLGFYASTFKNMISLISAVINKLRSLKSTVTEGIKEMAKLNKGSNEINTALSNLTSSLKYVKDALAAAFVPILTYIEPILTRLLNLLGEVINVIGMLIAKITGATSFRKAIRQQKDFAKSLDGVGNSAEGAAEKLASYDKLDVINKNSGSDVDSRFETISLKDFELPDWLKDLYELGTTVGVKLRDVLNSIPWESVKAGAEKAAKGISDFINGFFNVKDLGKSIGNTLGEVVNTITTFVNGLLKNIHWDTIGLQLGQGLTQLINSIEWDSLGQVFSNTINAAASFVQAFVAEFDTSNLKDAIHTFLENSFGKLDWPSIKKAVNGLMTKLAEIMNAAITPENFEILSTTLAETLNTVFGGIKSFVDNAEWKTWGKSIGTGIMNFFRTFDFVSAAQTVSNLALNLLDMLLAAVDEINFDEVGDKLVDFISNIEWGKIGEKAVEISTKLREGLQLVWAKLQESGAFDEIINMVVDFLGEKKNWETAFTRIKNEVIREVIWGKVKEFFSGLFNIGEATQIFDAAGEFFQQIPEAIQEGDFLAVGEDILGGICGGILGALDVITSPFRAVFDWIINGFKNIFGIHSPAEETEFIGDNIIQGIVEGFGLCDFTKAMTDWWNENVVPWFKFETWTKLAGNVWEALTSKFEELKTDLGTIWDEIQKKPGEVFEAIKNAIKAPINGAIGLVESFVNFIIDGINGLTGKLNNVGFDIKNPFTGESHRLGFDIPQIQAVKLPRLAQGAVIPPNRQFAAVLGDQKSGVNIETPLTTMIEAFKQAISDMGGTNQPVILQLNGRTVAQAVWDEEAKRYKQTGRYQTV